MNPEEFISKFQNLDGTLLKDKKRSLYLLLKENQSLVDQPKVLDDVVAKLIPNTYLEEVFRIEVLIFYQRFEDLLDVLKNGNDIFRSKIIKQSWFLKDIFAKLNPDQFVKDFLPTISYSVRLKILKNVIKFVSDEQKFDPLFDQLLEEYGISSALIILPACTKEKIQAELEKRRIIFTSCQLKMVFEKDPQLLFAYFEAKKEKINPFSNRYRSYPVFRIFALKYPRLYFEFMNKFKINYDTLGRKTTKKIILELKEDIVKSPVKFIRSLHIKRIATNLKEDFAQCFKNALPLNMDDISYSEAMNMLAYSPKLDRYDLYFSTFEQVYKKSLWDHVQCMNDNLLALVPKQEDRDKWLVKMQKPKNYIKYYNVESKKKKIQKKCLIKRKYCSNPRTDQFNVLIESMKLCEDSESLEKFLEFIITRHKNTEGSILYDFLKSLDKNFDSKKLNEAHWKLIYEIQSILRFKKQDIFTPLLLKYIEFVFRSGKPIDDLVLVYMHESYQLHNNVSLSKDFLKKLIQTYIDCLSKIEDLESNYIGPSLIMSIANWNKKYNSEAFPIDSINILIAALKNTIEKNVNAIYKGDIRYKAFQYLICTQNQDSNQDIKKLENLYWQNKDLECDTITMFFVKYKPEILYDYSERIVKFESRKNVILNQIKKLSHLELPQKLAEMYLKFIEKTPVDKKNSYVGVVSRLVSSLEYLELVKKYQPAVDHYDIDNASEENKQFFRVQCDIAKHLKNVSRDKAFPDVFLFCRGNYLKWMLPSLYSFLDRTPEKDVKGHLKNLDQKAVSVKKQELFLTCRLLSTNGVLTKYEEEIKGEVHRSLHKHLFKGFYKYFLRNPSNVTWEMLEKCFQFINIKDTESLKMLSKFQSIPDDYKGEYFQIVWNIYEKYLIVRNDVKKLQLSLVDSVTQGDIRKIEWDLCWTIIETKLFKEFPPTEDTYLKFVMKLLFDGHRPEGLICLTYDSFNSSLKKYILTEDAKEVGKVVHNFCVTFCNKVMAVKDKKNTRENVQYILYLFGKYWTEHFSENEYFDEYLMVQILITKYETKGDLRVLSEKIAKLFGDLITKYGILIFGKFKDQLAKTVNNLIEKDTDENESSDGSEEHFRMYTFLNNLLEINHSDPFCLLVIDLLPKKALGDKNEVIYNEILNKLRDKESLVQIHLTARLREL